MTVQLAVPPRPELFAAIRAVTRSASALADLTISDIEELQIAVGEAALLLLPLTAADSVLEVSLGIAAGAVRVTLSTNSVDEVEIDRSGLTWLMLTALVPDVAVTRDGTTTSITIDWQRSGPDQ